VLPDVVFAGQHLSWLRVMNIAEDPVVSWGPVRDDQENVLQGELWLIVAKNDEFIYFHLTDTPNSATNTTVYGGYTVKIKAIMTTQFYNFGYGSAVPIIGNDTDAFLATTTEMMVNSLFTEGEQKYLSHQTGKEMPYLVHIYNVEQSYSIPPLGSTHQAAIQYFASDGTALTEPFWQSWNESASSESSSGTDCKKFGDDVGNIVGWLAATPGAANVLVTGLTEQALSTLVTAEGPLGKVVLGTTIKGVTGVQAGIQGALGIGAGILTDWIYSALAEGACEVLSTDDDIEVLPPIQLGLNSPDFTSTVEVAFVCTETETVLLGSQSSVSDDGEVTVNGLTEEICTEGHYEVVA
jgi:hypothetical protein